MKSPGSFVVPAEYLPLHKYLDGRYADTVVLTFAEVEDLLGIALPEAARADQTWWANADELAVPSPQATCSPSAALAATMVPGDASDVRVERRER